MTTAECNAFVERVEELALGHVDEPDRARLLVHASSCSDCAARLNAMAELTDRLLLLAPAHDPAAGFESRVLNRLNANWAPARPGRLWAAARWAAAGAAIVVILSLVAYAVVADRGDSATVASAPIVRRDGTRSGEVLLVSGDHPYVVVVVDQPRPNNGEVYCELVLADGRSERVGSWDYDDVREHVWAVGVQQQWLDAVRMNVVLEDGTVVGTADLT